MKILLLGKNGQLGWELQRSLAPLGEIVALGSADRNPCGDLADHEGLRDTLRTVKPAIIVNAAAYTAVDKAETDVATVLRVNAEAPGVLAQEAARSGALLVHYSTDYVFDGSGTRPWNENDATAPLNLYGRSKRAGEQAIEQTGCRALIFRTSWVYAARGNNFIGTILRLAAEREELRIVDDQIGAPTGAELLADVTAHALRAGAEADGIYHVAAAGETSWYDFARLILEGAQQAGAVLKTTAARVTPCPSSTYPTTARRPLNSRLSTAKAQKRFDLVLPDWRTGVTRAVMEILGR